MHRIITLTALGSGTLLLNLLCTDLPETSPGYKFRPRRQYSTMVKCEVTIMAFKGVSCALCSVHTHQSKKSIN